MDFRIKRTLPNGEIVVFPLRGVTPEEASAYVESCNRELTGEFEVKA
jgi:hypothetical protein